MAIYNLKINKHKYKIILKNIKSTETVSTRERMKLDIDDLSIDEKYKPYLKTL